MKNPANHFFTWQKQKLSELLQNHSSLFILIVGAVSTFASNILLKQVLIDQNYGAYSLFITYLAIMYSFGLLGFEQIIIRFSNFDAEGNLRVSKQIIIFTIILVFIVPLLGAMGLLHFFDFPFLSIYKMYYFGILIVGSMLAYNLCRLQSKFLEAQIVGNLWKLLLLVLASAFFLLKFNSISLYFKLAFYLSIIIFVAVVFSILKSSKVHNDQFLAKKELGSYWFNYLLSIATITSLLYADRFLVESKFGISEFGRYFYLATFYLFPFGLLQNYLGFKKLIQFKSGLTITIINQELRKACILGLILSALVLTLAALLNTFNFLESLWDNWIVIFFFLLLGLERTLYAVLSSSVGATILLSYFKKLNIINCILMVLIVYATYPFLTKPWHILVLICVLWLIRIVIYYNQLKKQLSISQN